MGTNLRKAENYNIALDIGTGSVGWAVTDENGDLYSFKKKPTWGSRLFPGAMPASEARVHRGQRRRYDRRRQRLDLLQELFFEEMEKVDPEFFVRLCQARLLPEDREEGHCDYRWPLFNGSDFTEKDYYDKFPTIYHLRTWLMETDERADVRLIYLAFHNIVKTRGNFLHQDNPNLSAKNANMKESVDRLCNALEAWCNELEIDCAPKKEKIRHVLENGTLHRSEKKEDLVSLFGLNVGEKKRATEIAKAILGYKADFGKVYGAEIENGKFNLANDEAVDAFYSECPDDGVELFESIRAVYSAHTLAGILKGANGQTISYCKVGEYERYGRDLKLLKQLVREYVPAEYDRFFRGQHYEDPRWKKDYDPVKAEGYTRYNLGTSKRSYDDFVKDVKKLFAKTPAEEDPRYLEMIDSFDEEVFLRRLKTSDNGSIPYQLHLEELRLIIKNQGIHYPFLSKQQEKFESLVTFRIPYYVGPLTTKNARRKDDQPDGEMRFAWSERIEGQEKTAIRPWNWEEVIDKDKSAENFIRRMTGTCTYLQGEPVLPRCSLLYEKFCVLNELNGSRWTQDGDKEMRFDFGYRDGIYQDLFKRKRGYIAYKDVQDWLSREHNCGPYVHVGHGQGENRYESRLTSHHFFCDVLGVDDLTGTQEAMAEELILWNTLFEDRDILKEKVKRAYGDCLTDDQIKAICKKRFTGWGRLSKKLLCELKAKTANGPMSIMDILVEGNPEGRHVGSAMILMEILHDEHFEFEKLINDANIARAEGQGGLVLDELPGSPALRRSVNQAMRIVEEIVGIAGKPPANIFIEVTRDDDKKKKGKRTTRRYDGLKEALGALKAEGAEVLSELKGIDSKQLDQRLSLYFMQNGKSLYSGKPLDIRSVMSGDEKYQVDHIIPRSYVKDDSFENLALVLSGENQRKADSLLLDSSIRREMHGYWKSLHDAKLIGDKKYNNLMRSSVSDKQMQGFINRQLVETSQIVKYVRLLLGEAYPDTRVESVKASLSHQLREECGYVKCREANNYHHAHDALIAAEIGRFIQLRHPVLFSNPIGATHVMREFIRERSEEFKKTHCIPGSATFVVSSFLHSWVNSETGEYWDAGAECEKIRKYLNYKQCYISRMPEITSGAFWNSTLYSPKDPKNKSLIEIKRGLDPKQYGGYRGKDYAYFFVYRAVKDGKNQLVYEGIPLCHAMEIGDSLSQLEKYARAAAMKKGLRFVGVERPYIYKYQVAHINGSRVYITALDEVRCGVEIGFSQYQTALLLHLLDGDDIDSTDMIALFEYICDQMSKFSKRLFSNLKITDFASDFSSLVPAEQRQIILSLISIFNARVQRIDLSAVGKAKSAGQLKTNFAKEMNSPDSEIILIDQSVTGMFERRQRLEL